MDIFFLSIRQRYRQLFVPTPKPMKNVTAPWLRHESQNLLIVNVPFNLSNLLNYLFLCQDQTDGIVLWSFIHVIALLFLHIFYGAAGRKGARTLLHRGDCLRSGRQRYERAPFHFNTPETGPLSSIHPLCGVCVCRCVCVTGSL